MNGITLNPLLDELHRLSAVARGEADGNLSPTEGDFNHTFKTLLGSVNQAQQKSVELAQSFERGETSAFDLAETMIAAQKAKLSFQTALQVRNKLVAAYQDIMNMPL